MFDKEIFIILPEDLILNKLFEYKGIKRLDLSADWKMLNQF
jgi:hypothetical protein